MGLAQNSNKFLGSPFLLTKDSEDDNAVMRNFTQQMFKGFI